MKYDGVRPETIVMLVERMHLHRIIQMGAEHSADVLNGERLSYLGYSVARWDGDTLVVDTTNFTDRTPFRGPPATTRGDIQSSAGLHVVERFTRVSADRILYQFTVDDPNTWTSPWSAEIPMIATKGPLYEYACHEANYAVGNILRGARMEDAGPAR